MIQLDKYYENACFEWTCANVKQNALKVYMNTFYGEAGNSLSPFFLLQLAGGVTSAGQYNIKLVADFVKSKGFYIKYGDTDSLYLVCPEKYFEECDNDYVMGKLTIEEYYSSMVRITMRVMNNTKTDVNNYLFSDNGSKYLKMAYEEVLYPVVFTGKKKYYGIAHDSIVNFKPKKLFIRGIDIIKQGQSGMAKTVGNKIMWTCMDILNQETVKTIVENVIKDAVLNKNQWSFDDFIKSDTWRPNKKNISVHMFINRMKAYREINSTDLLLYELPEPGERFSYIIAKKDAISDLFDLHGRKAPIKKGNKMEFVKVAKALNIPIDVSFYMINYVVGICARFINSDFVPINSSVNEIDEKKIDEMSQKAAKKYLEDFIKSLENVDPTTMKKRGLVYKKAFTEVVKDIKSGLNPLLGELLHGKFLNYEMFLDGDDLTEVIWENSKKIIEKKYANMAIYCKELITLLGILKDKKIDQKKLYKYNSKVNTKAMNQIFLELNNNLKNIITQLNKIAIKHEIYLSKLVDAKRIQLELNISNNLLLNEDISNENLLNEDNLLSNSLNEDDHQTLNTFQSIWFKILGLCLLKHKNTQMNDYIENIKKTRLGEVLSPSKDQIIKNIGQFAGNLGGDITF